MHATRRLCPWLLLWPGLWALGCGGSSTPSESCTDGQRNQNETDVDCGGLCDKCANGRDCLVDSDCASGSCRNGTCELPGEECSVGDSRCNAAGNVETCAAPGDHWAETVCPDGCQVVSGQARCIGSPECSPGQTRCSAGDLETCDADGAWQTTDCQYGCLTEPGGSRCADAPTGGLPTHLKLTAGSGQASSASFRARLRLGAPLPVGAAAGSGKQISGGGAAVP